MAAVAASITNGQLSSSPSHIHDDIAFSVLSKLPLKSLTRFTSAKKSWSLLFQNPNFMNMFGNNFFISKHEDDDNETRLLIKEQQGFHVQQSLYILSGDRFENRVSLDWPLPFEQDDNVNANLFPFPFQVGGDNANANANLFPFQVGGDNANANPFPFQVGGANANLFPFQVGGDNDNANPFPFQLGGANANVILFPFQVGGDNANANLFPFQVGDDNANANANPFPFQVGGDNANANLFPFQVGGANANANADLFPFQVGVENANPFPFTPSIFILGSASVNGILCLYQGLKIVLWNPATTEFKILPPSVQPDENIDFKLPPHGFGYDRVTNDYKVIHRVHYPLEFAGGDWVYLPDKDDPFWEIDVHELDRKVSFWEEKELIVKLYGPFWEIYSLKSNSWRKLDGFDDMPVSYPGIMSMVNLNGFCHWLTQGPDMVSFDFSKERFIATTLPSSDVIHRSYKMDLVELNECLSLIYNYDRTPFFHIWVLGELGVKESWTKLFVVGPFACSIVCPISVGNKNRIFFREEDSELGWLDLSTQRVERIGVQGDSFCLHMVIYKESLLPFGNVD